MSGVIIFLTFFIGALINGFQSNPTPETPTQVEKTQIESK